MSMANDEQDQLLMNLKVRQDHKILSQKELKKDILNSARALLKGREMVFKAFESRIFFKLVESKQGTGLKILIPKQMLQRLPIALAQIKAGNNSKTLLNGIRQIVYFLYQSKKSI